MDIIDQTLLDSTRFLAAVSASIKPSLPVTSTLSVNQEMGFAVLGSKRSDIGEHNFRICT